jgi:acetyltransferase-like isoleucine patch superfamily enzyme
MVSGLITVGNHVWIAVANFIAPDETVGAGCLVKVRSMVFPDLQVELAWYGSPAIHIKPLSTIIVA